MPDCITVETDIRDAARTNLVDPNTSRRGSNWIFIGDDPTDGPLEYPTIIMHTDDVESEPFLNGDGPKLQKSIIRAEVISDNSSARAHCVRNLAKAIRFDNSSRDVLPYRGPRMFEEQAEIMDQSQEWGGYVPSLFMAEMWFTVTYIDNWS